MSDMERVTKNITLFRININNDLSAYIVTWDIHKNKRDKIKPLFFQIHCSYLLSNDSLYLKLYICTLYMLY